MILLFVIIIALFERMSAIFWQVAQNSLSFLLSYFVAQYVPIIVVLFFYENIFSFREKIFLVQPLKYANFHQNSTRVV